MASEFEIEIASGVLYLAFFVWLFASTTATILLGYTVLVAVIIKCALIPLVSTFNQSRALDILELQVRNDAKRNSLDLDEEYVDRNMGRVASYKKPTRELVAVGFAVGVLATLLGYICYLSSRLVIHHAAA